jgi:hypothetical protein
VSNAGIPGTVSAMVSKLTSLVQEVITLCSSRVLRCQRSGYRGCMGVFARHQWLTSVILPTWETEIRRITI